MAVSGGNRAGAAPAGRQLEAPVERHLGSVRAAEDRDLVGEPADQLEPASPAGPARREPPAAVVADAERDDRTGEHPTADDERVRPGQIRGVLDRVCASLAACQYQVVDLRPARAEVV